MQNDRQSMVLDTSFISALYKSDDALHNKAVEVYQKIVSGSEVIVPITVILELSLLTEAYTGYKRFQKFLKTINFSTYYLDIFFESDLQEYIKKTHGKDGSNLKPMDLSILVCAIGNNSKLITFDNKLQKAWKKNN